MGSSTSKKKTSTEIQGQTIIPYPTAKFKKPAKSNLGAFSKLPNELLMEIVKYLSDSQILSFSMVCKELYSRLLEQAFWIDLSVIRSQFIYFEYDYPDKKYCHSKCWYFHNIKSQVKEVGDPCVPERRQVSLIGIRGVGKTNLKNVVSFGAFSEEYHPTQSIESSDNYWAYNIHLSKIRIWDTINGLDYTQPAQVLLTLYSVSDRNSFEFIDEAYSYASEQKLEVPTITIVLVSTKNDLLSTEHVVKSSEGRKWAEQRNISFVESSAKTGQGMQHIRRHIMQAGFERNTD